MPIFSHSRLSSYEQCPLKYRYAYVDGIKMRRDHAESFLGSRFHEVMEHLYGQVLQRVPSLEELTSLFNANWDKAWHDGVIIHNPERTAEDYRAIGLRSINDYYRRYAPFDAGRVLGLERELVIDLDAGGGHRVRCIIDRLMRAPDGAIEIHDYKTSAFLPVQADLDSDRQLALYEIAVRASWPETGSVDLVWHYVAFDTELRSRRTPEQLAQLREETASLIDTILAATDFLPHESSLCSWCDFQPICPLFAHRFQVEALPLEQYAEEEGVGLVNRYAKLDAEKHELAERIKRIEAEEERLKSLAVEQAGAAGVQRLFGDTHMLSVRDDLRVQYPKKGEILRQDFEAAMRSVGCWEGILDVSWTALKSLADREGWSDPSRIPSQLTPLIKVERTHQVRLARRKDLDDDK